MRAAEIEAGPGPRFDFKRAVTQAAPEPSAPAARSRDGLSLGPLLSLVLHLLPLLLLLRWVHAPVDEIPMTVPVQLVIEHPPPQPVARPESHEKPPLGRLASEEIGAPADESRDAAAAQSKDARAEAEPSRPTVAEPELKQVASLVQPQNRPTLLDQAELALPIPAIEPLPKEMAAPAASRQSPRSNPRPRQNAAAVVAGPPAARDEYLAYLVTLVRPHLSLLTPGLLNGRHGLTSLAIRVLGDGTIARITVSESSGYPDIDARIMQIVAAVGRFPPLPPWIDQPSWDINFHLRFPIPATAM